MFAVIGAMHNRKTHKIQVTRSKFLMHGGIISLILIGTGILFIPVESVGNLIYIIGYYNGSIPYPTGVPHVNQTDIFGASSQIVMLLIFLGIMFIPGIVRTLNDHQKGIDKISHKHY
jgi:hypothetical protein